MRKCNSAEHLTLKTPSQMATAFRKCLRSLEKAFSSLSTGILFPADCYPRATLKPSRTAIRGWVCRRVTERGTMFARMTAEGRLLGFDIGDWTMLLGGLTLAALVALLV
jgi:hypothetical protein